MCVLPVFGKYKIYIIHAFDGLTDRQTDRQRDRHTDRLLIARPHLHSMQRDKKQVSDGLQFATH